MLLNAEIKSNRLSASQAQWNPFYKLGVSGNCRARVELKVWGVKEHQQWEDEEQRAAEECEGGVEWDEKDCWLKRARPNGWVDRACTDWVKNRVALFCFPPSLIAGLKPSAVTTSVYQQPCRITACLHLPRHGQSSHSPSPAPAHSILNNVALIMQVGSPKLCSIQKCLTFRELDWINPRKLQSQYNYSCLIGLNWV